MTSGAPAVNVLMAMRSSHEHVSEQVRCAYCADVIGVYEPLVANGDERARETSIAAEPELFPTPAAYHRFCYELRC